MNREYDASCAELVRFNQYNQNLAGWLRCLPSAGSATAPWTSSPADGTPSFLLEVMAQTLVKAPFGRYQDEIVLFLATAAERIDDVWTDPAGLGGDVNTVMSAAQKLAATDVLLRARTIAERAVDLEDDGQERAVYDEWKKLFGDRMTGP